jgi:ABC-type sugar transport system ATPase subunit
MYEESKKVLHELEVDYIDPRTIVKELSTSEKQLVEIAKALVLNSNILIMDEPTSSLTMHETKVLLNIIDTMRKRGVSIVYISHRLEEVTEIADKVTVMRDGELIRTCNIEETSIDKIVTDMVGRKLIRAYKRESTTSKFENKVVLEVNNLSNHKLKNISFSLKKGEILGITGLVGAGRTELLQSLFGLEKDTTGDIIINEGPQTIKSSAEAIKLKMGLVPEGRKTQGVFLNLSVKENMAIVNRKNYVRGVFISDKTENIELNKQKELLSIKTPNLTIPISSLSGGNQQKVVLSRWLLSEPDILLLDEPTHGIDVGAKSEIYEIIDVLSKKGVSIILVSSELPEVLMLADRIIVMSNGKITGTVDKSEATQELIMNYALEV